MKSVLIGIFLFGFIGISQGQNGFALFGKKNLIGVQLNRTLNTDHYYIKKKGYNFRNFPKFSLEHRINFRYNIGFAIGYSRPKINYSTLYNNNIVYNNILLGNFEDKTYYVYGFSGSTNIQIMNYELYIKKHNTSELLYQYGWYNSIRLGMHRIRTKIEPGATFKVKEINQVNIETLKLNKEYVVHSNSPYIGFNIGKNFPMYFDKLLFNAELAFDIFLSGGKQSKSSSFDETLIVVHNQFIKNYSNFITFNIGFKYGL